MFGYDEIIILVFWGFWFMELLFCGLLCGFVYGNDSFFGVWGCLVFCFLDKGFVDVILFLLMLLIVFGSCYGFVVVNIMLWCGKRGVFVVFLDFWYGCFFFLVDDFW